MRKYLIMLFSVLLISSFLVILGCFVLTPLSFLMQELPRPATLFKIVGPAALVFYASFIICGLAMPDHPGQR